MSFGSVTGYLSGGLIDPSTPNYAGAAAKNERMRQAQIDQGMQAINAVYQGGQYNQFAKAGGAVSPTTQYYTIDKKTGAYIPYTGTNKKQPNLNLPLGTKTKPKGPFNPTQGMGMLNGKSGLDAHGQAMLRRGNLYQDVKSPYFQGFGDDFYDKAAQSYVQYAVPQIAQQYDQTNRGIQYGLANRGLVGSSAQSKAQSDLQLNLGQQEQQVADNARTTATNLRNQVENSRQSAISNLYQASDPAGAGAQAVSSAAQFSVPQSFTPILGAFSNLANQYATSQLYNNYTPTSYTGGPTTPDQSAALGPTSY